MSVLPSPEITVVSFGIGVEARGPTSWMRPSRTTIAPSWIGAPPEPSQMLTPEIAKVDTAGFADILEDLPQLNINNAARHTLRDRMSVKIIFLLIVRLNPSIPAP